MVFNTNVFCPSHLLLFRYGVTLFAVRAVKKGSRLLLNPGPSHVMDYDDLCFYIAISREEDSNIRAYKEPKHQLNLFKGSIRYRNDSFITASSVALELRTEAVEPGETFFVSLFFISKPFCFMEKTLEDCVMGCLLYLSVVKHVMK